MIPICLVTGYLGSGKTTFLQETAKRYDRRLVFVVNDFSDLDVDGQLLSDIDKPVVSVVGGSIFCRCLVTEFIRRLQECAAPAAEDGIDSDGLVIEASGVADPRVIQQMLDETGLSKAYRITSIVSLVDPGRFLKLIHTLPNIVAQVQSADLVLLNKTDIYDESVVSQVEQKLQELNPAADVARTQYGHTSYDVFADPSQRSLTGDYAACADPNFRAIRVASQGLNHERFRAEIAEHADDIYRVKGFLRDDNQWYYLDYSGGVFRAEPASQQSPAPELVIILSSEIQPATQRWLDSLEIVTSADEPDVTTIGDL